MQKLIDLLYVDDKLVMFQILSFLEEDKNHLLDGNVYNLFKGKEIIKTNPPLKKFGLLPISDSMPLKQLLNLILAEEKIVIKNVNIKKISKDNKIGFIVFNRIVFTPVEYNIRSLIIKSVAQNYIVPESYGVNKKTVERFRTIRDYPRQDWNFNTEIYGESSEKFYIIETLDGINYRCMAPWVKSKTYGLPRFRIIHILNFFQSDINSVNRASNYHAIMGKKMLQNMFIKKPVDVEKLSEKIENMNAYGVRATIMDNIQKFIEDIIDKKYNGDIKSNVEINEIMHEKQLPIIFYENILLMFRENVNNDNLKNYNGGSFSFNESMITFIVNLINITRRFSKELHDGYTRNQLDDEIFSKNKKEKLSIITEKMYDVIKKSILLLIQDDDNPYLSLQLKYIIMNYT